MFTSSVPFAFADYMRIPVTIDPTMNRDLPEHVGALHANASPDGPKLLWARAENGRHAPGTRAAHHRLVDIHLVCPVYAGTPEELGCRRWNRDEGWRPLAPVQDLKGKPVAQIWTDGRGNVFLPFDPGEAMEWMLSERYTTLDRERLRGRRRRLAVNIYYTISARMNAAQPARVSTGLFAGRAIGASILMLRRSGLSSQKCLADVSG